MKMFMTVLGALLLTCSMYAQDCNAYYYLKAGDIEMTLYDKKQEVSGVMKTKISDVTKSGSTSTATFHSEMFNEKGKSMSTGTGLYKCTGGMLYVDARVAMPSEQAAQGQGAEVKAFDTYIEYPATMSAGMSLKNASFTMNMARSGGPVSTVTYEQSNRKVIAKESVTSTAGTWDCWKITYDGFMKMGMGAIGIPVRFQVTEWFAPGFGIVKSETRNKNGKMMGSSLITKLQ